MNTDQKQNTQVTRSKSRSIRGLWKPLALLGVILAILILSVIFKVDTYFWDIRDWVQSLGVWGPFGFMLIYIGAVVAVLPGSILGALAGVLFGSFIGVIVVSISSTIAASISFLIARYFARDAVSRWLTHHERFQRLDQLTEKQGAVIVGITRLIPLFPFNLLNYAFGLTKVQFRTYVFWSWLCMLPGTVVIVVGSGAIAESILGGQIPWLPVAVVSIGIVILVVVTWMIRKKMGHLKK